VIDLKAFITLETTLAAALEKEWSPRAAVFEADLKELLDAGEFEAAKGYVQAITMRGVADAVRPKIEELAISGLLFGAHHLTGDVNTTIYRTGTPLPPELTQAVDQLIRNLDNDATEILRLAAVDVIAKREAVVKEDLAQADIEDAGKVNPEQGDEFRRKEPTVLSKAAKQTLYINRPVSNTDELMAWAKEQGFYETLPADDLHTTVVYSKGKVDWSTIGKISGPALSLSGHRWIKRFGDAVVLCFESAALQQRNAELKEAGCTSDFLDYNPHVTISYDPNIDISTIAPFEGVLRFGEEVWSPVEENWKDSLVETVLKSALKCGCEGLTYTPSVKADWDIAGAINNALKTPGKILIDIAANLTTSRVIAYGFLSQAAKLGVDRYQINEVLDEKTCPVCILMHGRTFWVEDQLSRLKAALSTIDVDMLKQLTPFVSASKASMEQLNKMTNQELQEMGLGSPPYHPRCRGVLAKLGTVKPLSHWTDALVQDLLQKGNPNHYPEGAPDSKGGQFAPKGILSGLVEAVTDLFDDDDKPVTIEDFSKAGIKFGPNANTDKVVEFWNSFIKMRPKDFYEAMFKDWPEGPAGVQWYISSTWAGGDLNVACLGSGTAQRTFYVDEGKLEVDHGYLNIMEKDRGFGKQFMRQSMALYEKLGVSRIALHANIAVGGYAWAKYGFVPDKDGWKEIVEHVDNTITADQNALYNTGVLGIADKAIQSSDPKAIWKIADLNTTFKKNTVGKYLLLGSAWDGEFLLKDKEQMERFKRYVGQ